MQMNGGVGADKGVEGVAKEDVAESDGEDDEDEHGG